MTVGGGASRQCFSDLTPSSQYQISVRTQMKETGGPSVSITDMTCMSSTVAYYIKLVCFLTLKSCGISSEMLKFCCMCVWEGRLCVCVCLCGQQKNLMTTCHCHCDHDDRWRCLVCMCVLFLPVPAPTQAPTEPPTTEPPPTIPPPKEGEQQFSHKYLTDGDVNAGLSRA